MHGACHETQQAAGHRLPGPPPLAVQHEHARHEAQGCGPHIVELAVVEQYRVGPGQGSEHQAIYHDARPRVAHPGAAGGGPVQGCHHEGEQRRGRHARQQAREPRHEYVGHAPVGAQPVHRCIVGIGQQRAFARQGREPSLAEDDVVAHEVPAVECHCRSRRNGAQQHPRHVFDTAAGYELVVGAALHDFALLQHAYRVGILDRRQAVGNYQRGAAAHEVVEGLLHQVLTLGVECRGGLVENENGGILEYGAGNAQALPLSAREVGAAVAYVGVKSLLGGHDEVVGVGNLGSVHYLLVGSTVDAEGDVVVDGVVEENGLLVHIAHEGTQVVLGELPDVGAVDHDRALLHVVEAWQQVGQRCLAAAALSHQGHGLAARYVEVDAVDHPLLAVAESHALVLDALPHLGEGHGVLGVGEVVLGLEYHVDALHRGQAALYRVAGLGEILGRIDDAVEHHHVVDEGGGRDGRLVGQDEGAAKP